MDCYRFSWLTAVVVVIKLDRGKTKQNTNGYGWCNWTILSPKEDMVGVTGPYYLPTEASFDWCTLISFPAISITVVNMVHTHTHMDRHEHRNTDRHSHADRQSRTYCGRTDIGWRTDGYANRQKDRETNKHDTGSLVSKLVALPVFLPMIGSSPLNFMFANGMM